MSVTVNAELTQPISEAGRAGFLVVVESPSLETLLSRAARAAAQDYAVERGLVNVGFDDFTPDVTPVDNDGQDFPEGAPIKPGGVSKYRRRIKVVALK